MENYKNMKLLRRESAGIIKNSFFCLELVEDNLQKSFSSTEIEENWEYNKVASVLLVMLKERTEFLEKLLKRYQEIINEEKNHPSNPKKEKLKVHLLCVEKYMGYLRDIQEHIVIFEDTHKEYLDKLSNIDGNSKLKIFEYSHQKMIEG